MKEIYTENHINASPNIVWGILTDFDNYGKWNPFIKEISGIEQEGSELQIFIKPPNSDGMMNQKLKQESEKKMGT